MSNKQQPPVVGGSSGKNRWPLATASRPRGWLLCLAAACLLLASAAFYPAGLAQVKSLASIDSGDDDSISGDNSSSLQLLAPKGWSAVGDEFAAATSRLLAADTQPQQWLLLGAEETGEAPGDEHASIESSNSQPDGEVFAASSASSSHKSFHESSTTTTTTETNMASKTRADSNGTQAKPAKAAAAIAVGGGSRLQQEVMRRDSPPPSFAPASLARRRRASRLEKRPILNEFSFPANLVQGMRFVLMCQVLDGEAPVQIKWFKDNQELGLEFGKLQEEQIELMASEELGSASLLFRRVQQQHSGNYTCVATNHFGSAAYSSFMSVKVPPRWKLEPQDQESIMGEQITIDCQAVGNPSPFIRWKFTSLAGGQQPHPMSPSSELAESGRAEQPSQAAAALALGQSFKLINSNHHVQTLENGSLTIRQANKDHEGLYLCEADNGVEPSLIKVLRLVVHSQAQFADDIQALDGPGSHLLPSQATSSGGNVAGGGASQLPAAPAAGTSAQLLVASSPSKQQPMATPITTSSAALALKTVRVMQNATQLRLLCQPFGDQPLTLDWLKDGQLIYTHSASNQQQQAAVDPSSSAGGGASSSSLSLVSSASSAASGPMSAAIYSRGSFGQHEQQQQQLFSQQLGQRFHANTRRSAQRPQNGLDSELLITNLRRSDAGVYACVARNAFGQAERKLRLIVQEPPEPPEVVDVGRIASRSIGLRWLAPFDGNSPILKYIIEFRKSPDSQIGQQLGAAMDSQLGPPDSSSGQSEKVLPLRLDSDLASQQQQPSQGQQPPPIQVQHTVHDLEPLTRYSMRVVAVNAVGRSRPSIALSLRTEEEVPSVVPSLVDAAVLSSKSIKLHWTISYSPDHEIIEGFFVGYRSFEAGALQLGGEQSASAAGLQANLNAKGQQLLGGGDAQVEQPTFTYKTIRLTSQPPNSADSRVVGAETSNSDFSGSSARQQSAFLAPISSVTKTLPSSSSSLPQTSGTGNNLLAPVGSSGFHLSNSPPSSSSPTVHQPLHTNNNQRLAQHQQQQQQQLIVVSTFEYVIGGLERNTEYSIQIQCFNKKGAGPASDPVVFKTFLNDPPEKLALNADEVTESSVKLSWRFLASLDEHPALSSASKQAGELVDGYVLTFAKLGPNQKSPLSSASSQRQQGAPASANVVHHDGLAKAAQNSSRPNNFDTNSYSSAARISSMQPTPATHSNSPPTHNGAGGLDGQWQAIQLAPQQRSHQLKNLDCGSSYSMKIWAFNKIGKGEPSDLLTVSTRGKAPIPSRDARAFLSVNSTQVRLFMSAWDDGGCDIDKFIVQYRARGQQEWILVSNNILKEQVSVLIRDLLPATRYELLVSAQNQVGNTEVIYKFATLDSDGKQVFPLGHSFLGANDGDGAGDNGDYTTDLDGTTRREHWPSNGYNGDSGGFGGRPVLLVRQLLASPMALLLALCCFVVLLALLFLFRLNGLSSSSTQTLGSSNKSGSSGTASNRGRRPSTEANTVIGPGDDDGHLGAGPLSVANGSLSESPRLNSPHQASSGARYSQSAGAGYQPSECHYQSFCGGASGLLSQQQAADAYARSATVGQQQQSCSPYVSAYGQVVAANNYATAGGGGQTPYASVQRSATMDPSGGSAHGEQLALSANPDQRQQQQHCMLQLLMMGDQQQQQHNASGNNQDQSYNLTAALTTMARNKSNLKLVSSQMGQPNYGSSNGARVGSPYSGGNANMTLGRPHQMLDYHRLSAANQQAVAGNGAQAALSDLTTATTARAKTEQQQQPVLELQVE